MTSEVAEEVFDVEDYCLPPISEQRTRVGAYGVTVRLVSKRDGRSIAKKTVTDITHLDKNGAPVVIHELATLQAVKNDPHVVQLLVHQETSRSMDLYLSPWCETTIDKFLGDYRNLEWWNHLTTQDRVRLTVEWMTCSAHALAVMHSHRPPIKHRDIKPENLLLDAERRIIYTDFGLALLCHHTTKQSSVSGTRAYMAPEVREAHQKAGRKADVFALACVHAELFLPIMGRTRAKFRKWRINDGAAHGGKAARRLHYADSMPDDSFASHIDAVRTFLHDGLAGSLLEKLSRTVIGAMNADPRQRPSANRYHEMLLEAIPGESWSTLHCHTPIGAESPVTSEASAETDKSDSESDVEEDTEVSAELKFDWWNMRG